MEKSDTVEAATDDIVSELTRMRECTRTWRSNPPNQFKEIDMNKIINLTQHKAAPDQSAAGVVDLEEPYRTKLKELLTFDVLPTASEIYTIASMIALMANKRMPDVKNAMIGGAPFLMSSLEFALNTYGIDPLYAFSVRESVQETMPDGSIEKTTVFRHIGFVEGL